MGSSLYHPARDRLRGARRLSPAREARDVRRTGRRRHGDAAAAGSRQLEYREGGLFYRDVYFGVAAFAGLETVHEANVPRWSMAYAGGVLAGASQTQMRQVYAFLRSALTRGTQDAPFRGPPQHESSGYEYVNECAGAWTTSAARS